MVEKDENGKLRMSTDEFDSAFRALLKEVKVPELHGTVIHKTPGVENPGVGELVISAEDWAKRWQGSGEAAAEDWEKRALSPSGSPIGNAIKANQKRKDRLAESEKAEKWLKTMRARKDEDVFEGIQQAGSSAYKAGLAAKAAKTKRRIEELRPKVLALKQAIRAMSDATDGDREKRMLAARRGMLAIGGTPKGSTT